MKTDYIFSKLHTNEKDTIAIECLTHSGTFSSIAIGPFCTWIDHDIECIRDVKKLVLTPEQARDLLAILLENQSEFQG